MLQAHDLAVELDRVPLFTNVRLSLSRGDKLALVGPNGAGKSTLLRALAGEQPLAAGAVRVSRGTRLGLLRQDLSDPSLLDDTPALRRALARLGLPVEVLGRDPDTLSPGERMRAALAGLLADAPDLLLLDEPTNHLDAPARSWLVRFVRESPEGVLFVTHDRAFADAAADRTLILERGALKEYAGGYSALRDAQARERERQQAAYEDARDEARRLKDAAQKQIQRAADAAKRPGVGGRTYDPKHKAFYSGVAARMDKRAAAMRSRVERIEEPDRPFAPDALRLVLPTAPLRGAIALEARGLAKRHGDRTLFEGLSLDLAPGERLAVLGPNGAGKTTLLRGLLDPSTLDAGAVAWGRGARPSLLEQTRQGLDPERSAADALGDRAVLAALGLRGGLAQRPVGLLSGGERTRVAIAAMMLAGANVLLLDEPTNHLDLPAREALETALLDYEGAVVFTSHDPAFVEALAGRTLELGNPSRHNRPCPTSSPSPNPATRPSSCSTARAATRAG